MSIQTEKLVAYVREHDLDVTDNGGSITVHIPVIENGVIVDTNHIICLTLRDVRDALRYTEY